MENLLKHDVYNLPFDKRAFLSNETYNTFRWKLQQIITKNYLDLTSAKRAHAEQKSKQISMLKTDKFSRI